MVLRQQHKITEAWVWLDWLRQQMWWLELCKCTVTARRSSPCSRGEVCILRTQGKAYSEDTTSRRNTPKRAIGGPEQDWWNGHRLRENYKHGDHQGNPKSAPGQWGRAPTRPKHSPSSQSNRPSMPTFPTAWPTETAAIKGTSDFPDLTSSSNSPSPFLSLPPSLCNKILQEIPLVIASNFSSPILSWHPSNQIFAPSTSPKFFLSNSPL